MAMLAAWRVPKRVVRKAMRVTSRDGAGAQAAAIDSRWRRRAGRSCAGAATSRASDWTASRIIEFLPPLAVLQWSVAERDLYVSEMGSLDAPVARPGKRSAHAPNHPRPAPRGRLHHRQLRRAARRSNVPRALSTRTLVAGRPESASQPAAARRHP